MLREMNTSRNNTRRTFYDFIEEQSPILEDMLRRLALARGTHLRIVRSAGTAQNTKEGSK